MNRETKVGFSNMDDSALVDNVQRLKQIALDNGLNPTQTTEFIRSGLQHVALNEKIDVFVPKLIAAIKGEPKATNNTAPEKKTTTPAGTDIKEKSLNTETSDSGNSNRRESIVARKDEEKKVLSSSKEAGSSENEKKERKEEKEVKSPRRSRVAREAEEPEIKRIEFSFKTTPVPAEVHDELMKSLSNLTPTSSYPVIIDSATQLNNISKLFEISQLLCAPVTPEIAIIGDKMDKFAVVECLLGHPLVTKEIHLNRTVAFQILNNLTCKQPNITFIKETSESSRVEFAEVATSNFEAELEKRNIAGRDQPIEVKYERSDIPNMIFYVAPDVDPKNPNRTFEQIKDIITPQKRIIICSEACGEWRDPQNFSNLIFHADPRFERTMLINTHFFQFLSHNSTETIQQFFARAPSQAACVFITFPQPSLLEKIGKNTQAYKDYVQRLVLRDMNMIQSMSFVLRSQSGIGVNPLFTYFRNQLARFYKQEAPSCLILLRQRKKGISQHLESTRSRIQTHQTSQLRVLANTFVTNFLDEYQKLLQGTGTNEYGETLQDEHDQYGIWTSHTRFPLTDYLPALISELPSRDFRLFGAPQFERLLDEFKIMTFYLSTPDVSKEILNLFPTGDRISGIAEIAQTEVNQLFSHLLDQLYERAIHVMTHLGDISLLAMASRSSRTSSNREINSLQQYHYFSSILRSAYLKIVEEKADQFRSLCLHEFYQTKTLVWELRKYHAPEITNAQNTQQLVELVFRINRDRLAQSFVSKCYNFFFLSLVSTVWSKLQSEFMSLDESTLAELFQVKYVQMKLSEEEQEILKDQKKIDSIESDLKNLMLKL